MFYEVKTDARALLRAMKEYHEHHDPEAPRYERAIRHLVREGALVWEERVGTVPGIDFYRVTRRGLELLEEA